MSDGKRLIEDWEPESGSVPKHVDGQMGAAPNLSAERPPSGFESVQLSRTDRESIALAEREAEAELCRQAAGISSRSAIEFIPPFVAYAESAYDARAQVLLYAVFDLKSFEDALGETSRGVLEAILGEESFRQASISYCYRPTEMLDTGQLFELSEGWRVPPGAALVSVSADHGLWERHVPGGTGKLLRMLRGLKELYEAEGRKVPPNEYDEFRGAISQALDSRRIYWLGQFRARGLTGLIMKGREAAPDRSTATLNVESCPVPALLPTEFPIESRPARVRDFLDKRPGKYKVDIYLSAKVDKKNFRQWERGEMSNSSAMADRIEEVLQGEKALVERPKRP